MIKYSFFLSALLLCLLANAQQATVPATNLTAVPPITAASTAAECVQFINKKLRTYIGCGSKAGDTVTNVQFTGGTYMYQMEYNPTANRKTNSHTLYQTYESDINWAAYKSLYVTQYPYNGAVIVGIVFDAAHPVVSQSKYYNFQTGAQMGGYPGFITDTLTFSLPMAEQASVPVLETAFKRLSQLVKANPLLYKSEVFKPKHIEGKASFKETLEFIYNNFPKQLSYYGSSYDKYGNYESSVDLQYTNFTIAQIHNTDSMIITWYDKFLVPQYLSMNEVRVTKQLAVVFSIRDIERLSPFRYTYLNGFVTLEKARDATFPCGITLHAKQGKSLLTLYVYNYKEKKASVEKVSGIYLPTGAYSTKENAETVEANIQNSQLFKAFNHLRNLCGAPDPLKFD